MLRIFRSLLPVAPISLSVWSFGLCSHRFCLSAQVQRGIGGFFAGGCASTAQNRQVRTKEEMDQRIQMADASARMLSEQGLIHRLGEDAVAQGIDTGIKGEKFSKDVDAVMIDADKALNSNDPAEVLAYRRQLGKQIDWDDIQKNPSTPTEVQNATRARVYRAIGNKIHGDIPETVELDKTLQPNLELRSHMQRKLGDRVVDEPLAAKEEAQAELKKGQTSIENALHNEKVDRNWKILGPVIKGALGTAGATAAYETVKHLFE